MRAFVAVVCLLILFRLLATVSEWVNIPAIYRSKPDTPRVLFIRGAILLALFVWGSWALWNRS